MSAGAAGRPAWEVAAARRGGIRCADGGLEPARRTLQGGVRPARARPRPAARGAAGGAERRARLVDARALPWQFRRRGAARAAHGSPVLGNRAGWRGDAGVSTFRAPEHQSSYRCERYEVWSTPDPHMAYRLLRYMVRIWEQWESEHASAVALPAIVPVVLYHGAGPWSAPRSFDALRFARFLAPGSEHARAAVLVPGRRSVADPGAGPSGAGDERARVSRGGVLQVRPF